MPHCCIGADVIVGFLAKSTIRLQRRRSTFCTTLDVPLRRTSSPIRERANFQAGHRHEACSAHTCTPRAQQNTAQPVFTQKMQYYSQRNTKEQNQQGACSKARRRMVLWKAMTDNCGHGLRRLTESYVKIQLITEAAFSHDLRFAFCKFAQHLQVPHTRILCSSLVEQLDFNQRSGVRASTKSAKTEALIRRKYCFLKNNSIKRSSMKNYYYYYPHSYFFLTVV